MNSTIPLEKNFNNVGILQDDNLNEVYLEVSVDNPITRTESDRQLVTTYAIDIETNDSAFTLCKSTVRRRYSEFVSLRSILKKQHPSFTVPKLPGRTFLGKRFDQVFIEDRCKSLQRFLRAVVSQPVYLSSKSVHLFLQTSLSMTQIENVVNGKLSFEVPQSNSPLVLRPMERSRPTGRIGILKQESCASLGSYPEQVGCSVLAKHQHMRVGSGVVVCPFSSEQAETIASSSASLNINGMEACSPRNFRSTSIIENFVDGTASSLTGSKKKVSFSIESQLTKNLMERVEEIHQATAAETTVKTQSE